jgi:hypothetical protein
MRIPTSDVSSFKECDWKSFHGTVKEIKRLTVNTPEPGEEMAESALFLGPGETRNRTVFRERHSPGKQNLIFSRSSKLSTSFRQNIVTIPWRMHLSLVS